MRSEPCQPVARTLVDVVDSGCETLVGLEFTPAVTGLAALVTGGEVVSGATADGESALSSRAATTAAADNATTATAAAAATTAPDTPP